MKKEKNDKGFIIVTPSDAMWLSDGVTVASKIYTPIDADLSKWKEITEDEKGEIEKKIKSEQEDNVVVTAKLNQMTNV